MSVSSRKRSPRATVCTAVISRWAGAFLSTSPRAPPSNARRSTPGRLAVARTTSRSPYRARRRPAPASSGPVRHSPSTTQTSAGNAALSSGPSASRQCEDTSSVSSDLSSCTSADRSSFSSCTTAIRTISPTLVSGGPVRATGLRAPPRPRAMCPHPGRRNTTRTHVRTASEAIRRRQGLVGGRPRRVRQRRRADNTPIRGRLRPVREPTGVRRLRVAAPGVLARAGSAARGRPRPPPGPDRPAVRATPGPAEKRRCPMWRERHRAIGSRGCRWVPLVFGQRHSGACRFRGPVCCAVCS